MKRNCFTMCLALVLMLALFTIPAHAATVDQPTVAPEEPVVASDNVLYVIDPELLKMEGNGCVPLVVDPDPIDGRTGVYLKNCVYTGEYYYKDSPFEQAIISGPKSSYLKPISYNTKANWNAGYSVTDSMITNTFGVNFNKTYSLNTTLQLSNIPAGKSVTYKCFVLYNVYQFDIYHNEVAVGTGKYWIPVGIRIETT